jgi:hypothetical protein
LLKGVFAMTVPTTAAFTGPYYPNGVTVEYPFGFKVNGTDEVSVFYIEDDGSETIVPSADYSVVLSSNENNPGGTVTTTAPLPDSGGKPLYIALDPDFTQSTKFEDEGAFNQSLLNPTFDAGALRSIWLRARLLRAPILPLDPASVIGKFPFVLPSGLFGWTTGVGADANFRYDLAQEDGADYVGFRLPFVGALLRALRGKVADTISVKDWGAVGDGVTDDTAAIEAAIAAAPPNGTLIFPAGIYICGSQVDIARDDLTIIAYGATLRAKAGAQFEYVLYGINRSRVRVVGLTIDANGANRSAGQTVRFIGGYFGLSTDCEFVDCVAKGALGYLSVPGVGLAIGGGARCHVKTCKAIDCGGTSGTNGADGIYVSGDNCLIVACDTENCTDTGQVLENANNCGIIGGTTKNCNAGAAITNATNFDKRGNYIKGLSIIDWNSAVTGGVQIGCPGATNGDLYDTEIDVIVVAPTVGKGTGPAINVRKVGAGQVKGCRINATIRTASAQGILVEGQDVQINADIVGTGNACVQFNGASTGSVRGGRYFGGTFGVITAGTASIRVTNADIAGNAMATHGIYAFDTSSIVTEGCKIDGQTVARTGKDGGASLASMRFSGAGIELAGNQVVGARQAGWTAATGVANKGAFAAYAGQAVGAGYVQAQAQATDNAAKDNSQRIKALEDALRTHGLIN